MSTPSQNPTGMGWRFQRQIGVSPWAGIVSRIAAIVLALLVSGMIIRLSGLHPLSLAQKAIQSTVGSRYGLEQAGILATPLILTGLSVALCMRMRLWNVGGEGQLFMGAWAATAIGIHITDGPALLMFAVMFLAAALAGAVWILIPALVRAYLNISEVLTTLMLNFVAVLWVNHFAIGPWRDQDVGTLSASYRIPYELPQISGRLHVGILVAVVAAVVLGLMLVNSRWGYEVSTIGGNRRAAEFAGIPVPRLIITVMLLAGALSGVAGMVEVTGTAHRLSGTISNEYGYMGIIVAALANASPLACVAAGLLLAALLNAGIVLQTQGLSVNSVIAINGLILLFAAVGEVVAQYRLVRTVAPAAEENDAASRPGAQPPTTRQAGAEPPGPSVEQSVRE